MQLFLRFSPGSPGSFDFSCQNTNSASSCNGCTSKRTFGCYFPITLFSLEFQLSAALLVLLQSFFIFHISRGTFWFSVHYSQRKRKIRWIYHSAEHFPTTHNVNEKYGEFIILPNIFRDRKPNFFSCIDRYAKAEHILQVSWPCSFSFYSTVRPIFCICLHTHWSRWKLQPVITETAKILFITLMTAVSESTFIHFGDQKEHKHFRRVNKQWYIVTFYPVKEQTEPDACSFHGMCFRDLLISCTAERTASGRHLNVPSTKAKQVLLLIK
jgi:hypothetical protein